MSVIFESYNYAIVIILMMIGLYVVFASRNLIKKLVGLSVFQTSVFLLYITIGKVEGGQPPILVDDHGEAGGHAITAAQNMVASAAETSVGHGNHHAADVIYSKSLAACFDPHSYCGGRRDFGDWSGAGCAYPRGLRHD